MLLVEEQVVMRTFLYTAEARFEDNDAGWKTPMVQAVQKAPYARREAYYFVRRNTERR